MEPFYLGSTRSALSVLECAPMREEIDMVVDLRQIDEIDGAERFENFPDGMQPLDQPIFNWFSMVIQRLHAVACDRERFCASADACKTEQGVKSEKCRPHMAGEGSTNPNIDSKILKWSLKEILNERLHTNQLKTIPETFKSVEGYLQSFELPLLEESRAKLQQSLEDISSLPSVRIKINAFKKQKREPNRKENSSSSSSHVQTILFSLVADASQSYETDAKLKPTDLLLISMKRPHCLEDLNGESFTLAIVENVRDSNQQVFEANIYAPIVSPELAALKKGKIRTWFATSLDCLATSKRIWEALQQQEACKSMKKGPDLTLLKEVLCKNGGDEGKVSNFSIFKAFESLTLYPKQGEMEPHSLLSACDEKLLETAEGYSSQCCGLNESQGRAVSRVLQALLCRDGAKNDRKMMKNLGSKSAIKGNDMQQQQLTSSLLEKRVQLIQGPPGTGKTSTIAALLSIVSCSGFRTVVCAPTNTAVSVVALRTLEYLKAISSNFEHAREKEVIQFGNFWNLQRPNDGGLQTVGRKIRSLRKGDIALIGNEERINFGGPLKEIFFGRNKKLDRASRIYRALQPSFGWQASAKALLDLLNGGLKQYREAEFHGNDSKRRSFLEFFHEKFDRLARNMKDGGNTLLFDLPSYYIGDEEYEKIEEAVKTVCSIQKTIHSPTVDSTQLKIWISRDMDGNLFAGNIKSMTQKFPSDLELRFQRQKKNLFEALKSCPGYVIHEILEDFKEGKTKGRKKKIEGKELQTKIIAKNCIAHANLLFCTVSTAGKSIVKKSADFDLLLVDEAAQLVEAESIIALNIPGLQQVALVGDPKQLPATVFSKAAKECGYGRSLFERLQINGYRAHLLQVQYRMNPEISLWPRKHFYNGDIENGENVMSFENKREYQKIFGAYAFINVSEGCEAKEEGGSSSHNETEVAVVLHLLQRLQSECERSKLPNTDVGVITPYKSQVAMIEQRLVQTLGSKKSKFKFEVEVKSVDGFQGRERDVILFSAVRANGVGNVGFLRDCRRLNVAITRGRHIVWVVGHSPTLCAGDETWHSLIQDAQKRGCFVEGSEDEGIAKAMKACAKSTCRQGRGKEPPKSAGRVKASPS